MFQIVSGPVPSPPEPMLLNPVVLSPLAAALNAELLVTVTVPA